MIKVGDTFRLDFKVEEVNIYSIKLSRMPILRDGSVGKRVDRSVVYIYHSDATVEHVPKPPTVEVGQKYQTCKGVIIFTVLYIDDTTAFMSYESSTFDGRSWEALKNLLDTAKYRLIE